MLYSLTRALLLLLFSEHVPHGLEHDASRRGPRDADDGRLGGAEGDVGGWRHQLALAHPGWARRHAVGGEPQHRARRLKGEHPR